MTIKETARHITIIAMAAMIAVTGMFQIMTANAFADELDVGDKVTLRHDHQIRYGSGDGGYSNLMKAKGIDDSLGDRPVFCTQPYLASPSAGTYKIDKMYESDTGKSMVLRKLVYYAKGYPGWSYAQDKWFQSSKFDNDDIYGIFHIAISYVTDDYNDGLRAWGGGTVKGCMYSDNWAKMKEIVEDCTTEGVVPNPPEGFKVFYIKNSGCQNIIGGTLDNGELTLTKKSGNPIITDENDCYSIAGAVFTVYDKDGKSVGKLTVKADGTCNTIELERGTYTVRETTVPKGYAKAADQTVTVKAGQKTTVDFIDQPQTNPMDLAIMKVDAETGMPVPQGAASLTGAEFTMEFYTQQFDNQPSDDFQPVRTWVFKTDENGEVIFDKAHLVSGDDFYYQSDKTTPCLPLGTVRVYETKAPEGYLLNDTVYTQMITSEGTAESVDVYQTVISKEQVIRGDLEFVKVEDGTMTRLANVPFKITSLTTGESHIIVTDKNGYASTSSDWNKHSHNTNAGQTSEDGIWFGEAEPNDDMGALIYDDYEIEELRCEANEGMDLIKTKVSIYKDSVTVPLGTLTDDHIEIATTAVDDESNSHMAKPEKTVYIKDTVKYSGLKKGEQYKLTGTLMNKETGELIMDGDKPITAETSFTAKATSGEVEVEFKVSGELLKGTAVVVFEDLYYQDVKIAIHADIEDEGQTVYYPEIGTTARDSETNDDMAKADEEVTIIDTVAYSGLMPGKDYKVTGVIMDKATGKEVEVDGQKVTSEAEFTAEASSGTVDVEFKFSGVGFAGKDVVVFENLYFRSKELAVHADLNDEGQTIHFPEIRTTAKDSETGNHSSNPDESVILIDTVAYKNLKPGKEYTVLGTLMDKNTGEKVMFEGCEVTALTTFAPETAEGTVDVAFEFNGSLLAGKTVVVFENLYQEDIELAVHADINDEDQSVHFPEIRTKAVDGDNKDKFVDIDRKIVIEDTVSYRNLVPGQKYRVEGKLMDKATGQPILVKDKEVTAHDTFRAKDANGSVVVKFKFDGRELKAKELVVFEKLFDAESNIQIAFHEDINDEGQTVKLRNMPSIPKTGDETNLIIIGGIMLLAAAAGTTLVVRNKRRKTETENDNE